MITIKSSYNTETVSDELVSLMYFLYSGRRDTYGKYDLNGGGHYKVYAPMTLDIYKAHLSGDMFVGPYYNLDNDLCKMFSLDFDYNDFSKVAMLLNFMKSAWDWTPAVSTSKGKGFHLDTFISGDAVSCAKTRVLMTAVLRGIGFWGGDIHIDLFPGSDINLSTGSLYCSMPGSGFFIREKNRTLFLDQTGQPIPSFTAGLLQGYQHSRMTESRMNDILFDCDQKGWLDTPEKARVPDLFPAAVAQMQELKEKQRAKRRAQMPVPMPALTEEQRQDAESMYALYGDSLGQEHYETLKARMDAVEYPCVRRMLVGVTEGCRDEVCFRLIVHLRQTIGVPKEIAHMFMWEWNNRNSPPLPSDVVHRKVETIYTKDYASFGCERGPMQAFCHGVCSIMSVQRQYQEYLKMVANFPYPMVQALPPILGQTAIIGAQPPAPQTPPQPPVQLQPATPTVLPQTPVPLQPATQPQVQPPAFLAPQSVVSPGPQSSPATPAPAPTAPVPAPPVLQSAAAASVAREAALHQMAPGPTLLEKAKDGGPMPDGLQGMAAINPFKDPILNQIPPGFSIDGKNLVFKKDAHELVLSDITKRQKSWHACVDLKIGGVLITTENISFGSLAGRMKLFKKIKDDEGFSENYADAIMLEVMKGLDNSPVVQSYLQAMEKQSYQGGPMQMPTASAEQAFGIPSTVVLFEQTRGECRNQDPMAFASVENKVIHQLRTGVAYLNDLDKYVMTMTLLAPVNVPAKTNSRGQQTDPAKVEEHRLVTLLSSSGEVVFLDAQKDTTEQSGVASVKISRLSPPFQNYEVDKDDLAQFTTFQNRWSLESQKSFIRNKTNDPTWRPATTVTEILNELREIYRRFVYLYNEADYSINALWDLGTYLFVLCNAYPFLFLHGDKGSGKSTVCQVKNNICFNPKYTSNTTDAAIFRSIAAIRPTFILDEKEDLKVDTKRRDKYSDPSTDTITILNSSYKRDGSTVTRIDMERNTTRSFDTYCPKVIANITGISGTLLSRSIEIGMVPMSKSQKSTHRDSLDPFTDSDHGMWVNLRDKIYTWVMAGGFREMKQALDGRMYKSTMERLGLLNRSSQIWTPLCAIAHLADVEGDSSFMKDIGSAIAGAAAVAHLSHTDDLKRAVLEGIAYMLKKNNPNLVSFPTPDRVRMYLYDITQETSNYFPDPDDWIRTGGATRVQDQLAKMQLLGVHTRKEGKRISREVKERFTGDVRRVDTISTLFTFSLKELEMQFETIGLDWREDIEVVKR